MTSFRNFTVLSSIICTVEEVTLIAIYNILSSYTKENIENQGLTLMFTSCRSYQICVSWAPYMTLTLPPPTLTHGRPVIDNFIFLKKLSTWTFYIAVPARDIVQNVFKTYPESSFQGVSGCIFYLFMGSPWTEKVQVERTNNNPRVLLLSRRVPLALDCSRKNLKIRSEPPGHKFSRHVFKNSVFRYIGSVNCIKHRPCCSDGSECVCVRGEPRDNS